jgi:hypothetical protein
MVLMAAEEINGDSWIKPWLESMKCYVSGST